MSKLYAKLTPAKSTSLCWRNIHQSITSLSSMLVILEEIGPTVKSLNIGLCLDPVTLLHFR